MNAPIYISLQSHTSYVYSLSGIKVFPSARKDLAGGVEVHAKETSSREMVKFARRVHVIGLTGIM